MKALEVSAVSKRFKDTLAVNNLSLDIEEGEFFALLGPNGAGKSTTINMSSGLLRVDSGQIKIFDHCVNKDYQQTRSLTGVMNQELVIDNFFTVDNTLKIAAGYFGYPDDIKWREQLIEVLALGPYLKRKPITLSGGTKRRMMLAKALVHKPRLLILDEPTAGVDVELRQQIWSFVKEINQKGMTVLLTTHYLEEAEKLCNRVAIMNHGQLVALDETQKLLGQSRSQKLEEVFLALTRKEVTGSLRRPGFA